MFRNLSGQQCEQLVNSGVKSNRLLPELQAIKGELESLNDKEAKGSGGFTLIGGGSSSRDTDRRKINSLESELAELRSQMPTNNRHTLQTTTHSTANRQEMHEPVNQSREEVISKEQLDKWRQENEQAGQLRRQLQAQASESNHGHTARTQQTGVEIEDGSENEEKKPWWKVW